MTHGGVFEVVIRGTLGGELVDSLDGFEVLPAPEGLTRLVGRVPDQQGLLTMLADLDDLRAEVLSVQALTRAPDGVG
ncbi:hypothetical protein ACH3VR_20005 [Microbacterium sp. B2969]|uniref:Uncharacterized protein n=1 Tax=Microbacterium alkaliflavum TaxID=3248839 RepID=A0ABW7QE01_9MICO